MKHFYVPTHFKAESREMTDAEKTELVDFTKRRHEEWRRDDEEQKGRIAGVVTILCAGFLLFLVIYIFYLKYFQT